MYNVTINIEADVHDAWLDWMRKTHIPAMMKTGLFVSYRIAELVAPVDPQQTGMMYSLQYFSKDRADYAQFEREHAGKLGHELAEQFGEKLMSFRSVLVIIEENTLEGINA